MNGYLTQREAARRYRVSEPLIARRARQGLLPVYADGRNLRLKLFKVADLEELFGVAPSQGVARREVADAIAS